MISFEDVCVTLHKVNVLSEVNFSISNGETIGFFGVNGSGKTMLMRALLGLVRLSHGRICINGEILWKDIGFPRSVGFLIENPAFLDTLSGLKNLQTIASIKKTASKEQIMATLERVGLDPFDKKRYKRYSLGMKQKLGIAAAIMEKPDLIVLDEPTNALDERSIEHVKNIINDEKLRGATVVLACHDFGLLRDLSDRIFYVEQGFVRAEGDVA